MITYTYLHIYKYTHASMNVSMYVEVRAYRMFAKDNGSTSSENAAMHAMRFPPTTAITESATMMQYEVSEMNWLKKIATLFVCLLMEAYCCQ